MLHGRRSGPPNSPVAFDTHFGWVLAGSTLDCSPNNHIVIHHTVCASGDELLRKFWAIEEGLASESSLTPEERKAVQHFDATHTLKPNGRFVVPLPKRKDVKPLGESRSQVLKQFLSLEHGLHAKHQFNKFSEVIQEYIGLGHAELVPADDLNKPPSEVFYLPMHTVYKAMSTNTKIRAVFNASTKTTSGSSLNDTPMVGPTVHSSLMDVLVRF